MNVYTCRVPENLPRMKIAAYLAHALPLLPYNVVRDALKKRDVKANGKRLSVQDEAPRGAEVSLYTAFEAKLECIYEDEHLLIINKPSGLSSDTDEYGGQTLQSVIARQWENGEGYRPVHRLDNKTSGLLMIARDGETECILTEAIRERTGVTKQYECIVKGVMRPERDVREAFLVKDAARGMVRVISHNTPGSRDIRTGYETLSCDGEKSRLLVTLYTGRTHQIRAHMAALGHPLAGDDLYGDRNFNKPWQGRLLLCATRLTFDQSFPLEGLRGKEFSIQAPF